MTVDHIDLDELYNILLEILDESRTGGEKTATYEELSRRYKAISGTFPSPQVWGPLLGKINRRLRSKGFPLISALIVKKDTGRPGHRFWECCDGFPKRPHKADEERIWKSLLEEVRQARQWPADLPVIEDHSH